MRCPILWSSGPFLHRGETVRRTRDACPACGIEGVASTDRVTRWHP